MSKYSTPDKEQAARQRVYDLLGEARDIVQQQPNVPLVSDVLLMLIEAVSLLNSHVKNITDTRDPG